MNLSSIIDILHKEKKVKPQGTGRQAGGKCKFCNGFKALCCEESTVIHVRNWVTDEVTTKMLYAGKYYCQFCHRMQVK